MIPLTSTEVRALSAADPDVWRARSLANNGVPHDMVDLADECVEIPMCGVDASLNVAVAESLVLY